MPVSTFENSSDRTMRFVIEPNQEEYDLPPLARIGVKYAFGPDSNDRVLADIGEREIRFWCDSRQRQVEIVHPYAFDRLLWDICVHQGCCGAVVDGEPVHVTDLLPASGVMTAAQFAELVIQAEGEADAAPASIAQWTARLSALFVQHMGGESAPVEALAGNFAQPFDADYL